MANIKKEYERWLANATADTDVAAELKTLDDAKIEDAFYRNLAFGTGGLRGVIGAGTNRMNIYAGVRFKTYSGLPFTYEIRKGRNGQYTKELWIDRRENSKSLAWSSVLLALGNIKKVGEVVERPKALGDIRGVTYIYGMFYRFGLINVPDEAKEKMKKAFSKSS